MTKEVHKYARLNDPHSTRYAHANTYEANVSAFCAPVCEPNSRKFPINKLWVFGSRFRLTEYSVFFLVLFLVNEQSVCAVHRHPCSHSHEMSRTFNFSSQHNYLGSFKHGLIGNSVRQAGLSRRRWKTNKGFHIHNTQSLALYFRIKLKWDTLRPIYRMENPFHSVWCDPIWNECQLGRALYADWFRENRIQIEAFTASIIQSDSSPTSWQMCIPFGVIVRLLSVFPF